MHYQVGVPEGIVNLLLECDWARLRQYTLPSPAIGRLATPELHSLSGGLQILGNDQGVGVFTKNAFISQNLECVGKYSKFLNEDVLRYFKNFNRKFIFIYGQKIF